MNYDVEDSVIFRLESLWHLVVRCADTVNVSREVTLETDSYVLYYVLNSQ